MDILHIAAVGHHPEGIGTVLQHIVKEQERLGCSVRVISKYKNKTYSDLSIITITKVRDFIKFIRANPPQIVLFHSIYHIEYIMFYLVLRYLHIPYLIQLHGALSLENYKKNRFKKMIANYLFFNRFISKAHALIFLSEEERKKCIVSYLNNQYYILPNGCMQPASIDIKHGYDLPLDVVYIGRIDIYHKGLDLLVDALTNLPLKYSKQIRVSFYGNDDDVGTEDFKELLRPISSIASFCGPIYGDDKYKRLQACDLFIQTSRYEGLPMGVLEAISCGVPCIVTEGTNLGDILEADGSGWKCETKVDSIISGIMKAIDEFCSNPSMFSRNSYSTAQKFHWPNIAKKSIDVFNDVYDHV